MLRLIQKAAIIILPLQHPGIRGCYHPKIVVVFWNVNSRTNVIPVRENELGVGLVSGFSVNVCSMVLSNELDPFFP